MCRNRLTGADVEESLCNHALRPEPSVVQCNTHACPPKWVCRIDFYFSHHKNFVFVQFNINLTDGYRTSGVHVIEHAAEALESVSWFVLKRVMVRDIECQMKRVVEFVRRFTKPAIPMTVPSGSHLSGREWVKWNFPSSSAYAQNFLMRKYFSVKGFH